MNILFVTDVSARYPISGAERVLFEQSTLLSKRGHNVHILTSKLPEHEGYQELIQGVHEWRYHINQQNSLTSMESILVNCKRLYESLQAKFSYECINFHQPFAAYAVIRSLASKRISKVYTCHSLSFEEFRSRNPRPKFGLRRVAYFLNMKARKYIERKVLYKSDKITVLSRFTQEKLKDTYGIPAGKVVIIPGGIDLERFTPAANKNEIRRHLKIPEGRMILLTVRDLEPRMGLENLLYAFEEIIRELPKSYLVIGGHGPLKDRLLSLSRRLGVERDVKFSGFIPEEDLPDYYRMADIFILPSIELEGFGLITLEALASGVPVLGTPVGGTVEILGNLDSRYLFKDTKPESMASLIIETCQQFRNNPQLKRHVSARCRAFVEDHYSWESNINAIERLFEFS